MTFIEDLRLGLAHLFLGPDFIITLAKTFGVPCPCCQQPVKVGAGHCPHCFSKFRWD